MTKSAILTAAKDGNEEEVCEKLGEMLELAASGSSENRLMMQEGETGTRVVLVWIPTSNCFGTAIRQGIARTSSWRVNSPWVNAR